MTTFKQQVSSKYLTTAMRVGKFSIPDKIKKNIKMDGDVSTIHKWKAKIILANSAGEEDKIGNWDDVGYVGFKPTTGTIIPIARADEHHTGHELLDHYKYEKLIPKGNYYTIWVETGPNYANSEEDVKELIPVYKRWLELGGENLRIKTENKYMSFADLVAGRDGADYQKGKLTTFGSELVNHLEKLAILYKKALTTQKMRPPLKALSEAMFDLAAFMEKHRMSMPGDHIDPDDIKKEASNILKGEEIDKNLKSIFGFKGLKNNMHTDLKTINKSPKKEPYDLEDYTQFFGDIKFALEEFNRLSAI